MRLRLIVERNELPITCVIWFMPPDCSAAQLLINVNNVIPLESEHWALDDYVVEVPGKFRVHYELLHYEQLKYVLEDDTEVIIRPLQASELKERRISGRRQISRDGKHLLDGVPFGKALQRRSIDRPAVKIPPRRQGPFDLDDEENGYSLSEWEERTPLETYSLERREDNGRQLLLDANFGDDDSDDVDFEPAEDEDDDNDHSSDQETDTEGDQQMQDNEGDDQDGERSRQDLKSGSRQNKPASYRTSFPRPSIHKTPPNEHGIGPQFRDTANSEDSDNEHDEHEEDMDPLLDYYDHHGLPKGSIKSGMALHHMAGVMKNSATRTRHPSEPHAPDPKSVRFAVDISRDELSSTPSWDINHEVVEEESNDTSSSCISSASEASDSADDSEASSSDSDSDSEDATSSDDSSSGDDSAPEEESSRNIPEKPKVSGKSVNMDLMGTNQVLIPPGEGKRQTKARNVRRRNAKMLLRMQEKGILPDDTTAIEFSKLGVNARTTKDEAVAALNAIRSTQMSETDLDLTARRQKLLDSLESGGIEVGRGSLGAEAVRDSIPEASAQSGLSTPVESADSTGPSPRRARLDVGAGRRLLFGALGFKAPKTKHDEEKLRSDLMKDLRPISSPKPDSSEPALNIDDADDDPEAWRESIIYRAVECCHDNVQLSEPPFPFVQRWDPQQQGGSSKRGGQSGKRKKDLRDDPQFYSLTQRPSKKQMLRKPKYGYTEEQDYLDGSYEPSYEEDSCAVDGDAANESELLVQNAEIGSRSQSHNSSNYAEDAGESQEPADLALLPEDPSTLPDLMAHQLATGMTIAFKYLVMSEATKWQPQISSYLTAIIIALPGYNDIHLKLALRDREQPKLNYDEETGNRIYGRFDMPVEGDEEVEDDGMLDLHFTELIEPKIVQNAPDSLIIGSDLGDAALTGSSNSERLSVRRKKNSVEEQLSHITETPLHSEVPESHSPPRNIDQQKQHSIDQHDATKQSDSEYHCPAEQDKVQVGEQERPVTLIGLTENVAEELEAISDEAREEISLLMKEAGFRSSVSSSIQKNSRPGHLESPGDTAVFEQLMNDMTDVKNHFPSSPKFNGFGSSSPIRQSGAQTSLNADVSEQPLTSLPPQSSWQTIPFDEASSPPAETQAGDIHDEALDAVGESWETINLAESAKRKSKRKLHKAPSIQRANLLWEQLSRQTAQNKNGQSSIDTVQAPLERSTRAGLDAISERKGNETILHPKLSIGSSFTSQISDHGRQPDVVFEDSTTFSGDPARPSAGASSATHDKNMERTDDLAIDAELDLSGHSTKHIQAAKEREIENLDLSSDDPFPPLEVVLSQRSVTPKEQTPRASRNEDEHGDEDNQQPSSIASLGNVNYFTPKASENNPRTAKRAASQPNPKNRNPGSRSSQTPASQSQRKNFVVPEGSQVMDLTLSSDVEVDQDSLDAYMPPFRRYKLADNDDDAYEDDTNSSKKGGGSVKKKKGSSQTDSPRGTGKSLRSSSQTSSNPRSSRKKAVAKF